MKRCSYNLSSVLTLFLFLFLVGVILHLLTLGRSNIEINNSNNAPRTSTTTATNGIPSFGFLNYPYNNLASDVLLDPYAPPLRDERYLVPQISRVPLGAIPINVSTNIGSVDTTYRQVGILTPIKGSSSEKVLQLLGRPVLTNRDTWQYYCISNQHNNVKLPIRVRGKDASNEYGVNQLFSGDSVYVEGANEAYKTTIYENNVIKYLPFI